MQADTGLVYCKPDWQKTLQLFEAIEDNNEKVLLEPFPDEKVLAAFAKLSYTDCTGQLFLPKGWQLLTTARNNYWNNGYFGCAFWNPSEQQVVVAHRGTDPKSFGALWIDGKGMYCNSYTNHMSSSVTFADDVKKAVLETNQIYGSRFVLSFTGHSLGAWLAGVTTLTVKHLKREGSGFCRVARPSEGLHAHTLTLDSPGVKDMLMKICEDYDERYNQSMSTEKLDITTIFASPNRVNCTGFHVGDIYQLDNVNTHNINNFIKAFDEGKKKRVVQNWPQGQVEREAYDELERYMKLLDIVVPPASSSGSHQNTEPLEADADSTLLEDSTILPWKYRTTPSLGNICHLGVFSAEELNFLKNLSFFQSNTLMKLKKIENFTNKQFYNFTILQINLKRLDIPQFGIDIKENIITCKTMEDLSKVIRITKQLLRWFPEQIRNALAKQNESIKSGDPLYMAGQAYLRTLPGILNCEDTLGLESFLQSSKRVLQIETNDPKFEAARLNNIWLHIKNTCLDSIYLKDNCRTILCWNDLINIAMEIDMEGLNESDVTINNLLVLEFHSLVDDLNQNEEILAKIFKTSETHIHKKLVIILPQLIDLQLFKYFEKLTVETKSFKKFGLSDLTIESREDIFARDAIELGEKTLSLSRLLGDDWKSDDEQVRNKIDHLISPILKKLVMDTQYIAKIPNKLPKLCELDALYSKGNNKLVDGTKIAALLERSEANGPLLVISDPQQLSQDHWGEVAEAARGRIFTTEKDGQELFLEKCREEPERIIYWFQLSTEGFSLNTVYNKSAYIDRKFHSRVIIKFIKEFVRYRGSKDLFIFKNARDKISLISHFVLSLEDQRTFVSKDHFKVDSGDIITEESFSKHYFELDCTGKWPCLVWQYSKGSLDGLRPFIKIDYSKSTEDEDFCRTRKELVIIADDPGMGKTTSLTGISEFNRDSWVLRIDHKLLDSATAKLPMKLNLQSVTNYLIQISDLPTDNDLLCNVLRHCLETEKSMQICVLVDAFDEIPDEKTKVETVKLLKYLKTATTCQTVITTRLYRKEWLENDLAEFAVELEKITENEQENYLVKYWLPHLALEHTKHGESEKRTLRNFARELRKKVEGVLGKDMASFMCIPLQIRLLAEVFLQQAIQSVVSHKQENKLPKITNLFDLYKQFINVKETIFFGQKTNISKLPSTFQIAMKEYVMKMHCILAFKAIDPIFATEYFTNIKFSNQELKDISCLGLIQSKTKDTFSFIHRTFQEYFCADFFVRWLRQERKSSDQNVLIKKEISKFLFGPDYRTIRMFIETQLVIVHKLGDVLENHPMIYKHWSEVLLFNDHEKTPLHIAAEEQNFHTFTVLLGGPDSRISDQAYISFIAARDKTGRTALNIARQKDNTKMVDKLIDYVKSCSYESLLKVMLATFLDIGGDKNEGDGNDSDSDSDSNSDDNNGKNNNKSEVMYTKECFPNTPQMKKVNQSLKRVQQIRDDMLRPFITAVRKDQNDIVLKILRNLENDTERDYLLRAIDSRGNTAINLATRKQDHVLFKEFAKLGVCVSYDKAGQNPLHCAADEGYITIVNYLLNQSEETYKNINSMSNGDEKIILKQFSSINSQDNGGNTALMLAAQGGHKKVVRKLLDSGIEVNSADNEGFTAMINSVNKYGNTALMFAAMKESRKVMRMLIKKGANINSANNDGDTALMYAAGKGYYEVVHILLKANADTKNPIIGGETALSRAILYGHLEVVECLLKHDPNILFQDNSWKSALSEAKKKGYKEIFDLINDHQEATSMLKQ